MHCSCNYLARRHDHAVWKKKRKSSASDDPNKHIHKHMAKHNLRVDIQVKTHMDIHVNKISMMIQRTHPHESSVIPRWPQCDTMMTPRVPAPVAILGSIHFTSRHVCSMSVQSVSGVVIYFEIEHCPRGIQFCIRSLARSSDSLPCSSRIHTVMFSV